MFCCVILKVLCVWGAWLHGPAHCFRSYLCELNICFFLLQGPWRGVEEEWMSTLRHQAQSWLTPTLEPSSMWGPSQRFPQTLSSSCCSCCQRWTDKYVDFLLFIPGLYVAYPNKQLSWQSVVSLQALVQRGCSAVIINLDDRAPH